MLYNCRTDDVSQPLEYWKQDTKVPHPSLTYTTAGRGSSDRALWFKDPSKKGNISQNKGRITEIRSSVVGTGMNYRIKKYDCITMMSRGW